MLCLAGQARFRLDILRILICLHNTLEHPGDGFGADLVCPAPTGLDDLTESNRAFHGLGHVLVGLLDPDLGKRLPAANDLCRIVHLELVALIGQQGLKLAIDVAFFHRQHQHLVVHQQATGDGFRESDDMQLRPVQGLIIHRVQRHIITLGHCLGTDAVDARSCRHVQAPGSPDVVIVMHPDESAFVIPLIGGTGGAVRLITDDEIKIFQLMHLLSLMDHVDRMVGAEHHRHVILIMPFPDILCEALAVCRGWIRQLMNLHLDGVIILLAALLPDITVGADCKTMQGHLAFMTPLGQCL